jgi:hypothetical protein
MSIGARLDFPFRHRITFETKECEARILEAAGIRPIRLYDLRHTAATLTVAAGVSVKAISDQLGHASISFTLERYSHVLPSIQDEAMAKVERMLLGSRAGRRRSSVCRLSFRHSDYVDCATVNRLKCIRRACGCNSHVPGKEMRVPHTNRWRPRRRLLGRWSPSVKSLLRRAL